MEKSKKKMDETRKKKTDPLFEIEGNQKLNKMNKLQFKKEKKERARRGKNIIFFLEKKKIYIYICSIYILLYYLNFIEKAAIKLAGQLEEFNISTSDDYDFNTDFVEK